MDRLFLATLTLCLAIGGTLAIGSDWHAMSSMTREVPVIRLDPVVVTAKRLAPQATVAEAERVEPAARVAQ